MRTLSTTDKLLVSAAVVCALASAWQPVIGIAWLIGFHLQRHLSARRPVPPPPPGDIRFTPHDRRHDV